MRRHTSESTRARLLALALAVPLAALGACGGSTGIDTPGPSENPLADAAATITAEDMIHRIGVLAHDSMEGRDTPSRGLEAAARYIVDEFRRMGLEGGAEGGEYIQRYPFPLIGLDTTTSGIRLSGAAGAPELTWGEDFIVSVGAAQSASGSLVYVGPAQAFATSNPAAGSLAGRIPVAYLEGSFDRTMRVALSQAGRAARAAGAQAIVFVLSADMSDATWDMARRTIARPRRTVGEITDIPTVLVRNEAAQALFAAAGLDLGEQTTNAAAAARPVSIGTITANVTATRTTLADDSAPNVVAILRGSDPELADEYVVFSAHMDHVGIGAPDATGDSIYNGADDDASGTAALIEVAEAFSYLLERPRRSLIFLAVSGEEKGLLGSRYFSDHPTVPMENIVANINVDMIGRNAPDSIVVIGQEYSSLGPLVQRVGATHRGELGLTVSEDIWPEERFFFRSDHFNFARKDVPALFFFTGVHEDYHRPSDEVEKIDGDKAHRIARLIFYTAHEIADTPARPTWTEEGLREVRALTGGGR